MPRAPKACAYFGCENRVVGKSWCPEHQSRWPKQRVSRTSTATWKRVRTEARRRAAGQCEGCGSTDVPLQCDHIRGDAAGGTDSPDNAQMLCLDCHGRKTQDEAQAARR